MTLHTRQHFGTSWKEARLCYDALALETLERGRDFLTSLPQLSEKEVSEKLNAIGDTKRPEYWKEALSGLDAQVQAAIVSNLESLETRTTSEVTRKALQSVRETFESLKQQRALNAVPLTPTDAAALSSLPAAPKSFMEKTGAFAHEVKEDFTEGGWGKKTAYIATGFIGFIAARYLWKKAFGSDGKEGFVKKGLKWTASIVGAGLGILGIKSAADWWTKTTSSPWSTFWSFMTGQGSARKQDVPDEKTNDAPPAPGPIGGVFNAGRDIVQGGGGAVADTVGKALETGKRDAKFWVDLFQTDNMGEAMELIATEGLTLAYENGKFVLYDLGWNAIATPALSLEQVMEWGYTGKKPENFWALWGSSGAVYFIGKNALSGRFKAFLPLSAKDVTWTLIKIGTGPSDFVLDLLKTGNIVTQEGGMEALKLRYLKYNVIGSMRRFLKRGVWNSWFQNDRSILKHINECVNFSQDLKIMERFSETKNGFGKLFGNDEIAAVRELRETIAERVRNYTQALKVTDDTPELLGKLHSISHITDTTKYFEELEKIRSSHLTTPLPKGLKIFDESGDAGAKTGRGNAQKTAPSTNAKPGTTIIDDGGPLKKVAPPEPAPGRTSGVPDQKLKIFDPDASRIANTGGDLAQSGGKVLAGAEALLSPAESAKKFDALYEEVRAARALKDNGKLLTLLRSSAELIKVEAAAGNRTAQAMQLVLRTVNAAKWAGRALLILGPLVDSALLIVNRFDIRAAREAGNMEMVRTLESKEKVLATQGGIGLSMLLMTGPQALAVAPFAIASSVIANKIYDSVIQWETSSRQWMNQEPEALKQKLKELKVGYRDLGHTAANLGFEGGEKVNQNMRQEILTAYFLKTMRLPAMGQETDAQYEARAMRAVQDRLSFVKTMTAGTFAPGPGTDERFFGGAEDYGNLAAMDRALSTEGKPRVFTYEWEGKTETLDLGTLDYVRVPNTGNEAVDQKRQMSFLKTVNQYRDHILMYSEAVRDMEAMASSVQ